MEDIIASIAETLSDYREHENNDTVRITTEVVRTWIDQFDEGLRLTILAEIDEIFKNRYCPKEGGREFLKALLEVLARDYKAKSIKDFLNNVQFLSLQRPEKSQTAMLAFLNEILNNEYGMSLDDCGSESRKYSVYIDDVLCSGLTLISNLQEWATAEFAAGKTNKTAVEEGATKLIVCYIFIHEKNYHKKIVETRYKISKSFSDKIKVYRMTEVENVVSEGKKLDFVIPVDAEQPEEVAEYRAEIIEVVDVHTAQYNAISPEEFFRPVNLPKNESLFTSSENRKTVEDAFLLKGIEILSKSNVNNKNMRALGYSLPSVKNFGFGALCFTWRNVPNNTPLVFWYAGGGFTPLFKVYRRGGSIFNFTFGDIDDFDDLL